MNAPTIGTRDEWLLVRAAPADRGFAFGRFAFAE